MNKKNFFNTAKGIAIGLALVAGSAFVFAEVWTPPTAAAPGNNTPAPINVSSVAQTKSGALTIDGGATVNTSFKFTGGSPDAGKILRSDAVGNASWIKPTISFFSFTAPSDNNLSRQNVDGVNQHSVCFVGGIDFPTSSGKRESCRIMDDNQNKVWRFHIETHEGNLTCYATCMDF